MISKVEFYDEDHVWLNGQQFISLRRFHEAIREAREGEEHVTATDITKPEDYYIRVTEHGDCRVCLRQGCPHRDGTIRVNCPLYRRSAV